MHDATPAGFSPATLDFLWDVSFYNERAWFLEHKQEYRELVERPLKELAEYVRRELADSHPQLGLWPQVSRIYRDQRRSHGKGPYKDHLWFSLRPPLDVEWFAWPTPWFEIGPDSWCYGCGYYQARPATMAKLRRRIDRHPRALQRLTRQLQQQEEFVLEGPEYARPKGDPGPLLRPWYNKRSLVLIHREKAGEALFGSGLAPRITAGFRFLMPYYEYLTSLESDAELA
ncbi:MAG: DUF2461 domain-containing protein [Firmicutes bacterium]|nr:DUF2461 domain-containing protein [Bacillota bacterium]